MAKKKIMQKRLDICRTLYDSGKEEGWEREEFYKAYNQKLIEDGLTDKELSDNTIYRDCADARVFFKKSSKNRNKPQLYPDFGETIGIYISQIRCTCKSRDIIILNGINEVELMTEEEIEDILFSLFDAAKPKDDKTKISTKQTIASDTMVHLYFIFSVRGFEHRLAEILDTQKMNERDFLYINIHNYCTEVVFEFQYLDNYIKRICEICSSI